MPGRLEFGFNFAGRDAAARRDDDAPPARILLMGDFSGSGAAGDHRDTGPLRSHRIDIDNFDDVLGRIGPTAVIAAGGADEAAALEFRSLDDFHPDHLYASLPVFAAMQELRSDLSDPARFPEALARLGDAGPGDTGPESEGTPAPAAGGDGDSPLDALLGGRPAGSGATPTTKATGTIDRLISDAIAPHITPGEDPRQAEYVASVDLAISSQMRTVLADASLRHLESMWRGVWWLVTNADEETVSLHLVDIGAEALAAGVGEGGPVADLLDGDRAAGDPPWSMVAGLFEVGGAAADIELVDRLGDLASPTGASVVAGAAPALLGLTTWADGLPPDTVAQSPMASDAGWRGFRSGPAAAHVGLAAPRVLLRLPYGPDTDEIDAFDFTELVTPEDHDAYLWGNAAFAVTMVAMRALSGDEAGAELLDDLPAHAYRLDGEMHLTPAAECYLGERAAEAMLAAGVMPLVSVKNRNAVQLLRLQTVADPATALPLAGA